LVAANLKPVAVSEESFVSLGVYRYVLKRVRRRGAVEQVADIIRVPITSLAAVSDNLVLLLGGAGAGKSTALLRMIYLLCEKIEKLEGSAPVPVFFRAQELTSPAEKLLDAVFTRMQEIGGTNETPIGSKELNAGLLCLFVDGPSMNCQTPTSERL
jgi:hypothetical protein